MGPIVWLFVVGGTCVVPGSLAYAEIWRSWTRAAFPPRLFGMFWLGVALVCLGVAFLCMNGPFLWVPLVLMPAFVLCGALGLWMALDGARWATPGWYRRAKRR